MNSPILIVIDMENDFLLRWEPEARRGLVDAVNNLADDMRAHSHPILWVRQEFEPDLSDALLEVRDKQIQVAIKGTAGCQFDPGLAIDPRDTILIKKRYSAFFGTPLDDTLAALQADAIILAGINTHACIRTTAIDAYQRDWRVILALDCIDSYDSEHHEVSLRYMRDKIATAMTNREIHAVLASKDRHTGA